jgi:hypothetical protein
LFNSRAVFLAGLGTTGQPIFGSDLAKVATVAVISLPSDLVGKEAPQILFQSGEFLPGPNKESKIVHTLAAVVQASDVKRKVRDCKLRTDFLAPRKLRWSDTAAVAHFRE